MRSSRGWAGVTQLVECDLAKVDVAGSNPVSRSKIASKSRIEGSQQTFLQMFLESFLQLRSRLCNVEYIDRLMRLGVDEHNVDAATFFRYRAREIVQKA